MQLSGMMGWSGRDPGSRLHYLEAGARLRSAVAGPGPDGGTSGARGTLRVALAPGASSHRARHGRRQAHQAKSNKGSASRLSFSAHFHLKQLST